MDIGRNYSEPPAIDYRKLSAGLEHYESLDYQCREVPWVVSREAMDVTRLPESPATSVQYGNLVASGEQSFIELMQRGEAVLKACCITPCFRIEKSYDELHRPYFMKLELIHTHVTEENLQLMLYDAQIFFEKYTDVQVKKNKTLYL